MLVLILAQRALGHVGQRGQTLIDHIPHAHRQVIAMTTVNGHAFKAVAVMGTGFLTWAVIAGFAYLTEKFHLHFIRFLLFALLIELILLDGQRVVIDLHK